MKRVGKIETTDSIVYKAYEVIETDGRYFAGIDAFSYPDNKHDLRGMECIVIPLEWRWIEQYEDFSPYYGELVRNKKGRYDLVRGDAARDTIEDILTRHETGALILSDAKYPYAIPINHAYRDGKL